MTMPSTIRQPSRAHDRRDCPWKNTARGCDRRETAAQPPRKPGHKTDPRKEFDHSTPTNYSQFDYTAAVNGRLASESDMVLQL